MIEAPKWIKNPKADVRGWRDRQTGELLKAQRFTLEEVHAYEDARATSFVADVEAAVEGTDSIVLVSNEWDGDDLITTIDIEVEPEFSTVSDAVDLEDLVSDAVDLEDLVSDAVDLESMTKDQLLALAEEHNIEAYKSWPKDKIIAALT